MNDVGLGVLGGTTVADGDGPVRVRPCNCHLGVGHVGSEAAIEKAIR